MVCIGSVIGAGQKSGTAQSIIILVIEVVSALATSIWLPWGKGAHMSLVSFLFCVLRIVSSVLLVILSPAVSISLRSFLPVLTRVVGRDWRLGQHLDCVRHPPHYRHNLRDIHLHALLQDP